MQTMREAWTDERLDDLNRHVEEGFRRIDGDLRALRVETKTELTALRGEMSERFDAMQRLMIQVGGVIVAALIGLIATQV
jgi:hypothetical protein